MLFTDSITYQITVVDENRRPIPAATIWVVHSGSDRPDITKDLMERLVARYANPLQADYVHRFPHKPHDLLEGYSTTEHGNLEIRYERNDIGKNRDVLPISIAAIKRGYRSSMVYEESPVNSRRKIVLQLSADPQIKIDPDMLRFDSLRAQSRNSDALGATSDARADLLDHIRQQIIDLARRFEQSGKPDEAAILNYHLAYMPAVERRRLISGEIVVSGYTNGYDERDEQRAGYLAKALQLNKSNPQIAFEAAAREFENQGVMILTDKKKRGLRSRYIALMESYLAQYPNDMWPWVYYTLPNAYAGQGELDRACEAWNRFYRFEPLYYNKAVWKEKADGVALRARMGKWEELRKSNPKLHLNAVTFDYECRIEGL